MQIVLSGKLRPPPISGNVLPRTRLINRLLEAKQPLILIQSPAGYGKSILLSQWYKERIAKQLKTAWVSFDPSDSNIETVLMYMVKALQEAGLELKGLGNVMSNPLHGITSEEVILSICSELEKSSENIVLILEDLHCIELTEVDLILDLLIKRSPDSFQLVISSRDIRSLSLSTLRAQERLLELTSADLRFVEQEICEFMQIDPKEEDYQVVEGQTEGWAIALQLMQLHRRGKHDEPLPLAQSGSEREDITNYLTHQVLETLPDNLREFLIDTAFLDRICSSLSDTILGRFDSVQVFAELKSLNGLLDPIDSEHTWYRHHSLFTDYLRRLLHQKEDEYVSKLHLRACRWFADNDFIFDAIKHAVLSGDSALAASLFENAGGPNIGWQKGFELLRRIMASVPAEWIDAHPSFKIAQAMIDANDGDINQAKKLLAEVKAGINNIEDSNFAHYARSLRLILVGYVDYCNLDTEIEEIERYSEEAPGSDLWFQGWVYSSLWLLYFRGGMFSAARMAGLTAVEKLSKAKAYYSEYHANLDLGIISMARGRVSEASRYYGRAKEIAIEHFEEDTSLVKIDNLLTANIHYHQNDMETATRLIDSASDQLEHLLVQSEVCINCYMTTVRIIFSRDGLDAALALLDRASDFAVKRGMKPLEWLTKLYRIEFHSRSGHVKEAEAMLLENQDIMRFDTLREKREIGWREYQTASLVLTKLYFYMGTPQKALRLLDNTVLAGEASERTLFKIAYYALRAEVLIELNKEDEALDALTRSLEEAMKENLVRPLINDGERFHNLLKTLVRKTSELKLPQSLADFALNLIKQFEANSNKNNGLFTSREQEILEKIKEGTPNKVIAYDLGITEATVKFHLSNIYTKLGVRNRTHAVSAAQRQNLV